MTKFEIYFFPNTSRRFGDTHTYQVEAEDMLAALALWARDWPEGCAYGSKEGWDVAGHRIIAKQVITGEVIPVEVVELSPKERRALMKAKKP
jgi:hypothetical protein